MRFASLGSGSEGNALVVALPEVAGESAGFLLVDCGFNRKEAGRRLAMLGLSLDGLRGILVTHEHSDHIAGVFRLAAATSVPVHLTWGTREAARHLPAFNAEACRVLEPDREIDLLGLGVLPFSVPHDAREPVQYAFDDGQRRLGLLTDIGRPTPHVVASLGRPTALVLETNHDRRMLADGHYPPSLKRRIGGDYGHLENSESAAILQSTDRSRLRVVVAAHLSRHNNRPDLARGALAAVLGCEPAEIGLADQDEGSGWQQA